MTSLSRLAKEMFDLLGCVDLDLRIQAGEAVALLYEATRSHDPRYRWTREKELCAVLNGVYVCVCVYVGRGLCVCGEGVCVCGEGVCVC